MHDGWIFLQSLPFEGTTVSLENHPLWASLTAQYLADCQLTEPLCATVTIMPQETGVLFTGELKATVAMACYRCTEEKTYHINQRFTSFEPFPPGAEVQNTQASDEDPVEVDDAVIRMASNNKGIEINPAALVWQEFSLALPVKPLCSEACKGLCPNCGCNKNTQTCSCNAHTGDPRLEALQGLKITKN